MVSMFDSTTGILTPEEAATTWENAGPFELTYRLTGDPRKEKMKLSLLYSLTHDSIDAHTGEKIEFYTTKKLEPYLIKIKGHPAEIPLDLLAQTGRLPAPEAFDPDASVTRREFLRILELAGYADSEERKELYSPFPDVSVNDPDIWAILNAVWCGIIEPVGNLRPDDPLTRENAAAWLTNLIKNEQELAFLFNKEDQTAFTQELILAGTDNNSNSRPQEPITWGELAVMITKTVPYLNQ